MEFTMEEKIAMVRGAIIGALAGGHMEGRDGVSYSKNVLLQIADFLGFLDQIPENVKDGTIRQRFTMTIESNPLDFLPPDPTLD